MTTRCRRYSRRQPGTVYITVLVVSLVVALMAASAARLARIHLRGFRDTQERHVARLLALSAIDHALVKFDSEPAWESTYLFDTEYPTTPVPANEGSFTWKLVDVGGGQKRLDGIGRAGDAECVLSVNLASGAVSVALQQSLLCGGHLYTSFSPNASTIYLNGGTVCSNSYLENWGTISGNVEAQSETVAGTVTGTRTVPGTFRSLPDSTGVFEYYMQSGTVIPTASLPENSGARELKNCVLSPASNPYGAVNPDGIYIIDTPNIDILVRDCRIVGTLVVRNPGFQVQIKNAVNWEPARGNWPALMIQGDLFVDIVNGDLTESMAGTNLNPSGTPWQGTTDGDTSDSYPNAMAGILYATGNVTFDGLNFGNGLNLEGVLICGGSCRLTRQTDLILTYDNAAALNPPPGFGAGDASSIVGGSWRQTASP